MIMYIIFYRHRQTQRSLRHRGRSGEILAQTQRSPQMTGKCCTNLCRVK
jgi:hypothetical protein